MRHILLAAAILAAGACSNQSTPPPAAHAKAATRDVAPKASIARAARGQLPADRIGGIASLPDRGTLVAYPRATPIHDTAYTWRPVSISESHAIAAIAKGELELTAPDGSPIRLRYSRHVEHADGNWTWIGSPAGATPGNEAIITFGPTAVFGTIPMNSGDTLRLTTIRGRTWMLETDGAMEARMGMTGADPSGRSDVRVPPRMAGARADAADMEMIRQARTTSAASGTKATANASTANAPASSTVDLLVGYTPQFASRFGGTAGANTRITFLVDVTNQAYAASQIDAAVRLAGTLQVDYTENNSNSDALYALTGVACTEQSNGSLDCNDAPVPASLAPLVAMRATVGADIVTLIRNFNSSAQQGCGIAWLLGAGQTAIVPSDSDYGYSVVSDSNGDSGGSFPSGGFVCRDEAVAHELGHLMGAQHDRETAADTDGTLQADEYGRFPYSFGYRGGSANIYTVMAYGASGQHKVRVFSNPNIACTWSASVPAAPCGIADQADNARALRQTIPVVAAFRATVNGSDLYLIPKMGASGTTEVHVLTQASNYSAFALHQATALHTTGTDFAWRYLLGDYNRDGILDLYAIAKTGGSGTTEVHVLNGATRFTTFLVHTPSALHQTGTDNGWVFRLGDYNHDGVLDLWAITRNGATGTEIHILNGANNFATFLVHTTTPVQTSGTDGSWHFLLGDYNRDGALDVYMVVKANTGSNTTEVHVLNGANFNGFLLNTATVLHTTGTDNAWDFELSDYNADGTPDIVVIAKNGLSNTTEFHVLDGATRFATYGAHIATALQQTGSNDAFEYEVGVYR